MIAIRNEDCMETMRDYIPAHSIDIILTSPFYNTNSRGRGRRMRDRTAIIDGHWSSAKYDTCADKMTNNEYNDFTVGLFNQFDTILKENGVVLYNLSYGAENTTGMFTAINAIVERTEFTIADVIVWKKKYYIPANMSPNRLTRTWEFIFVICRKKELKTFKCNKPITNRRKSGQATYSCLTNYIEARNNDEVCPYNKAAYSSELCEKLLDMYAVGDDITVYDPFMGSGTTAVACQSKGIHCIGSEISEKQCQWALDRLERMKTVMRNRQEGGCY